MCRLPPECSRSGAGWEVGARRGAPAWRLGHHKLLGVLVGGQLRLVGVALLEAALVSKVAVRLVQLAWKGGREEGGGGGEGGWMGREQTETSKRQVPCCGPLLKQQSCRQVGGEVRMVKLGCSMLLQHSPRMAASASVSVLLPTSTLRTFRVQGWGEWSRSEGNVCLQVGGAAQGTDCWSRPLAARR